MIRILGKLLRFVLPVLVLGAGIAGAWALVEFREDVEVVPPPVLPPPVEVLVTRSGDRTLDVATQGTVRPHAEVTLTAEVSGRIVKTAPALADGGFFEAGDELLRIDDRDYELARISARAAVAEAQFALEVEQAEADAALEEWTALGKTGDPPALVARVPQLARARANVEAAKARLEVAERDLERAIVRAPFAGRVAVKHVDAGQWVPVGTPLADVYAVDWVEARLPLADDELAFVSLPLAGTRPTTDRSNGSSRPDHEPIVELRADFAGREHVWAGRIVRTEGQLDPRSRMVHAVVRIDDPYGLTKDAPDDRPPLLVGMFVRATIRGREARGVHTLPRTVLRGAGRVFVIDTDDRLRVRDVDVLRTDRAEVVIGRGIDDGDRICLTPLDSWSDGMRVRVLDDADAAEQSR